MSFDLERVKVRGTFTTTEALADSGDQRELPEQETEYEASVVGLIVTLPDVGLAAGNPGIVVLVQDDA